MDKIYSDEELLNIIKDKAKELGRTPSRRELTQNCTIINRFGSWNNVLEKAGLKVIRKRDYEQEELLNQIRERAKELGRTLRKEDIRNPVTIRKYFGTVTNALRLAGEKTFIKTDDELILQLKTLSKKLNRVPTANDLKENNLETRSTYSNRFGSWNNALKLANIKINQEKSKVYDTDEELIGKYINLCNKLNRFASTKDIDMDDIEYSNNVFVDRFKSINNLKEIVLYDDRLKISNKKIYYRENVYSDEELKEMLKEVVTNLEKATKENVVAGLKERKYPSINTFFRRFQIKHFKELLDIIN